MRSDRRCVSVGPPGPCDGRPDTERDRFDRAREALTTQRDSVAAQAGEEEAAIFDGHRQFLSDPQIDDAVAEHLAEWLPAEHAVDRAFADAIEQFQAVGSRITERTDDLRKVRDRLLRRRLNVPAANLSTLPPSSVVVAPRLGPSDTAQLNPDDVSGFATATGGRTSHTSIMARSLGIPAVVGVDRLNAVDDGVPLVVDGGTGEVVDPSAQRVQRACGPDRDVPVRPDRMHPPRRTTSTRPP